MRTLEEENRQENRRRSSDFAQQNRPAMVMVHSQSGIYGNQTALARPDLVKALINVEGRSGCNLTPEQSKIMAGVSLVECGRRPWVECEDECRKAVASVKSIGGNAEFLATYEKGVRGNTHMMMMDTNNLQVA